MVNKLLPLASWFQSDNWPLVPCPDCSSGMSIDGKNITNVEAFESAANRSHDDWEPTWIRGHFHGVLHCGSSQCGLRVVVLGDYKTDTVSYHEGPEWHGEFWGEYYKLKVTHPPISIMNRMEGVPEDVWLLILDASRLAWVDPAAAAGRLRAALEALMSNFKIKKFTPKRKPRTLHERLIEFEEKKPDAGKVLPAVKWVGNEGAHGNQGLKTVDILDSADLMEYGLKLLYDKSPSILARRAAAINKAKRIPRSRISRQA